MNNRKFFSLVTFLLIFTSGCVIPIPHKRVSRVGCEGVVLDARTGNPIREATVCVMYEGATNIEARTDAKGHYRICDETTWHGAYFIGVPASFSLFPTLDAPLYPLAISVSAEGYDRWKWQAWIDIDSNSAFSDESAEIFPSTMRLNSIE